MSKQITDQATKATPVAADYVLIRDLAAGTDKKATLSSLLNAILGSATSYTNPGTAGGSFWYINLGFAKFFWGATASISITGSGFQSVNASVTLPVGFFSSLQTVLPVVDIPANTQYLSSDVLSKSTTAIALYLNQNNGTNGSAPINLIVIGT